MKVYGIDFTSRPSKAKPITNLHCEYDNGVLNVLQMEELITFDAFESVLERDGRWVAGIDFPFGQSRKFIENIGWPSNWADYVTFAHYLGRKEFRQVLDNYRKPRKFGDKEHRRMTDILAGSISPQKLYGVPVGLMFFEGSARLVNAGVDIPHLHKGDHTRIVFEAYPGVLARKLVGRKSYKTDTKSKQTSEQLKVRKEILFNLSSEKTTSKLGFKIIADMGLALDPSGDHIDALLCAVQAAWAWSEKDNNFGAPENVDPLEGWIANPKIT